MDAFGSAQIGAIVAIVGALALILQRSLACGHHRRFVGGKMRHLQLGAIALAISRIYYGVGRDYVGLAAVEQEFVRCGLPKYPGLGNPITYDIEALDRVLRRAASLSWKQVLDSGRVLSTLDKGSVDFITLAFRLFGLSFASLHHMFFALLAAGAMAFTVVYHANAAYLWFLAGTLVAFYLVVFESALLTRPNHLSSLTNPHLAGLLAIVPTFHLVLAILEGQRLTPLTGGTALLQIILLLHVVSIRSTAAWAPLLAVPFAGLLHVSGLLFSGEANLERIMTDGTWVLALLLACRVVWQWHYATRLNPVYFSASGGGVGHSAWHTAYVGLAADEETYAKAHLPGQWTRSDEGPGYDDRNAYTAVSYRILSQHPDLPMDRIYPELDQYYNGMAPNIRWDLHNALVKQEFLAYFRKNVRSMPGLYLWHKPRRLLDICFRHLAPLASLPHWGARALCWQNWAALSLLIVGTLAFAWSAATAGGGPVVLGGTLVLAVTAPAPNIWAYSRWEVVGEQVWVLLMFLWGLVGGALWFASSVFL